MYVIHRPWSLRWLNWTSSQAVTEVVMWHSSMKQVLSAAEMEGSWGRGGCGLRTQMTLSQGHTALYKQTTDQHLCICPWSSTDTSIAKKLLCSSMTSETTPCGHQQNRGSTSQSAVKSTWRFHRLQAGVSHMVGLGFTRRLTLGLVFLGLFTREESKN